MHWYTNVIKNYTNFNGRATRKEYWMFVLFNFIISFAFTTLCLFFGQFGLILSYLYPVFILLPTMALSARRLHDINLSAWFLLLLFIPFGSIAILFLCLLRGTHGTNKYDQSSLA